MPISEPRLPPITWTHKTLTIPTHLRFSDTFPVAIDGTLMAYIYFPPSARKPLCQGWSELRLLNMATKSITVLDRLPTPPKRTCSYYTGLNLSYPWVAYRVGHQSSHGNTLTVVALNLRTRRQYVVATADRSAPHDATNIAFQDLSQGTLALEISRYRGVRAATSIELVNLATQQRSTVIATPLSNPLDSQYWGIGGLSISDGRVVWTRVTNTRYDVMLYDGRTRHITALTQDGLSLGARIYGDTVAWVVSTSRSSEGDICVYDLSTGKRVRIAASTGYNVEVGDELVSWDNNSDLVPLYSVRRQAVQYYAASTAEQKQDAYVPAVRIFGHDVLVTTILHFTVAAKQTSVYRVDVY